MGLKFCQRAILLVFCLVLVSPASANWMGSFELDHGSTSYLGHGELARVTCDFKVTNTNGARFVVDALYNGSPVPGRAWGGSSLYPAGTVGTHTNFITFYSGDLAVDQYRIRMFDPVTSATLLDMMLPVTYFFGPHAVNNIQMSYSSPSWVLNGDFLSINFDYQTDEAGGVRIAARPFTDGSLSPGYGASGVPLSPVGTGSSSQSFTFSSAVADVDEVRFQVTTADFATILLEFFVPVDLHWGPNSIANIQISPPDPESLAWDQNVTVEFDYATSDPGGCHIWARGMNEEQGIIANQVYTGSPLEPVSGHITRQFRFQPAAGEGEVHYVHIRLDGETTDPLLMDLRIPVFYHYGPNAIQNVQFYPASPAVLDHGEHVDSTFDYVTNEAAGVRIYNYPYRYGAIVPPYAVKPSILYFGSGSTSSYFTVTSGDHFVNSVQMRMKTADTIGLLLEAYVPCHFTFGGVGGVTAVPDVPLSMGQVLGQNYPNPFNPVTVIPVDLDMAGRVVVKVYDLRGRLVGDVADVVLPIGRSEIIFDGRDLPSGAYFYALETGQGGQTKRMMLIK